MAASLPQDLTLSYKKEVFVLPGPQVSLFNTLKDVEEDIYDGTPVPVPYSEAQFSEALEVIQKLQEETFIVPQSLFTFFSFFDWVDLYSQYLPAVRQLLGTRQDIPHLELLNSYSLYYREVVLYPCRREQWEVWIWRIFFSPPRRERRSRWRKTGMGISRA
jgi:hypothetical protein